MRKIVLYIAQSLDGKIADSNGGVNWLESIPNPDKTDYGYADFYSSVDTTIQGNTTYKQIINWGIGFPYSEKKNYVITGNQSLLNNQFVEFVSGNYIEFFEQIKHQTGNDIWLIGGGHVNTLFLNAGLIDEVILFTMPVIIGNGIKLFEGKVHEFELDLISIQSFTNNVVRTHYSVI